MRMRGALAVLALAVLAGCGNDPRVAATATAARSVYAAALGAFLPARLVPAPVPPVTRAAIDASITPLRIVTLEVGGATAVVAEAGWNGGTQVFAAANGVLVALRDGVLIGTRGLGPDLMSADAPTAAALRRATGTHPRAHFYLAGDDRTIRRDFDCALRLEGPETLTLVDLRVATARVAETCTGAGGTIENTYWFDSQGRLRQSRQWIGPVAEYARIVDPMR